jgi:hypothetical protein|tara:strand:- start:1158 stop:1430 length:273 start_codon:yes stop_codon:yes gene_type:complete
MKIFIYKLLISIVAFYILFELTIGAQIKYFTNFINNLKSDDQRIIIKEKVKDELRKAVKKDRYFTVEESQLISSFLLKLQKELFLETKDN